MDFNQPIQPEEYQKIIGTGFSTNYFKSQTPLKIYNKQNVLDVKSKGFSNLRLRIRADLHFPSNRQNFQQFLNALNTVVDDCLEVGICPILSWIHFKAQQQGTQDQYNEYVNWWTMVAQKLKYKDYRLTFNLFTELGDDGPDSLRKNINKYILWSKSAIKGIRNTGGNNEKRIIILSSPGKKAKDLIKIDKSLYQSSKYFMAESHSYASGPNKQGKSKDWHGNGKQKERKNLINQIKGIQKLKQKTGLLVYFGAWMPYDNLNGDLTSEEAQNFSKFFVKTMRDARIPWSLNVLDRFYDTQKNEWIDEINVKDQMINTKKIIEIIYQQMQIK